MSRKSDSDSNATYTIEPDPEGVVVMRHGTYPDSSVLAGQYHRAPVDYYQTVTEARAAYPKARVLAAPSPKSTATVPLNPPADFDPSYAGERWDDDY